MALTMSYAAAGQKEVRMHADRHARRLHQRLVRSRSNYDPAPLADEAGSGGSGGTLPPVLDACCGSRMFWFDKCDPRALFVDKRRETHSLPDVSSAGGSRTLVVDPDIQADFTALPFPDGRAGSFAQNL